MNNNCVCEREPGGRVRPTHGQYIVALLASPCLAFTCIRTWLIPASCGPTHAPMSGLCRLLSLPPLTHFTRTYKVPASQTHD